MFCLRCGYALQSLPERCPECGRRFDPARPSTYAATAERHRVRRAVRLLVGAVGVALLGAAAYAASFYMLVRLVGPGGATGAPPWPRHAVYPFDGEIGPRFYGPMESIDQWLRPRAWEDWGFAQECIPAYEFASHGEWSKELQDEADDLLRAIHDTWLGDEEVESEHEALKRGEGTQADVDAAIANRKELVARALDAEKQFRAHVAAAKARH